MSEEAAAAPSAGGAESNSGGEGFDSGMEAQEEKQEHQPPKLKKPAPKMRQVKVNGQVEYVDEEGVFKDYQKYRASDERLKAAAQKEAEINKMYRQLEDDPDEFFRKNPKLSGKKYELAMKWMEESLQEDLSPKTPEQIELEELRAWKQQQEDEKAAKAKKDDDDQKAKFKDTRKHEISTKISEAMKATPLSAHPESAAAVMKEMAAYMRAAREQKLDVTPDELVEHVHNIRFKQFYTLANTMEGPDLVEFLGPEVVKRIRKHDLEQLRKSREIPVESYRSAEGFSAPRNNSGKQQFIDPSDARIASRSMR